MLIALIGDSCTGKSSIAEHLRSSMAATVFSGKDYLRLAKDETTAAALFKEQLAAAAAGGAIVYVISEPEQLDLLPEGALRVLVTASLETIQRRFAERMHGTLPAPVADMLKRKHGRFEAGEYALRIDTDQMSAAEACSRILSISLQDKSE